MSMALPTASSTGTDCKLCGQNLMWCTCLPDPDEEAAAELDELEEVNLPAMAARRKLRETPKKPKAPEDCGSCGQRFVWCVCSPTSAQASALGMSAAREAEAVVGSTSCSGGVAEGGVSPPVSGIVLLLEPEPESGSCVPTPSSPAPSPPRAMLYWGQKNRDDDFGVGAPSLFRAPGSDCSRPLLSFSQKLLKHRGWESSGRCRTGRWERTQSSTSSPGPARSPVASPRSVRPGRGESPFRRQHAQPPDVNVLCVQGELPPPPAAGPPPAFLRHSQTQRLTNHDLTTSLDDGL